ncbi:hypothetical protein AX16_001922 [Volvariella volvacea WC 439]|nr:hypothetical protein AX16_001922 [Volvariella volvacea WC 439]
MITWGSTVKVTLTLLLSKFIWVRIRKRLYPTDIENLPGPKPASFIAGNLPQIVGREGIDYQKIWAEEYGPVMVLAAVFGKKMVYVADPLAMHHIVVKDQYVYEETTTFLGSNKIVFGESLLSSLGEQHKRQRKMLNPVFSTAHIRQMAGIFVSVADRLCDAISAKTEQGPREESLRSFRIIDILDWLSRTALELIGQSGLGYSFDPLVEGQSPHPYGASIKNLIPANLKLIVPRILILPWAERIGTPRFRRSIVDILPWKSLHALRDIIDTMHATSVEIVQQKKKALAEGDDAVMRQVGQGKDIISILLRANMEANDEDKLTDDEVLGQLSSLTFAATDTTSSAISRILHLLAEHPEAQERLRNEVIRLGQEKSELTYDNLESLPYLDAVCRETLRLCPPLSAVLRTARKDMILPLSKPVKGKDGRMMKELHIPKNTDVIVAIRASNRNPAIWGSDAYEWKPERWLSPLPEELSQARIPGIYSHLMTFIGGGRACIGFKFAQLEMKVVLAMLIERFKFETVEGKDILWTIGGISTPYVRGDPTEQGPKLPMRITLIRK